MSSKLSFSSLKDLWGNFPKGTTGIINLLQTTQSLTRRWQYYWGACAFQGMYQTLLFFQREAVFHFKKVKVELKCFKKSLRDPLQLSSAIPLWSACHPAGCFSRLDLSLRLVPGGSFLPAVVLTLLQLSLCKHRKERDGTAALWLVWGIRKWKFPVCLSLATSGALQLMKLSHVSGHSLGVWTYWLHWLLGSRHTRAVRAGLGCGITLQKGHRQRLWGNGGEDLLCSPVPWAHYHI